MSAANYMNVINGSIVINVTAVTVVMDVIHAASNRQLFEDCYQLLVEGFVRANSLR